MGDTSDAVTIGIAKGPTAANVDMLEPWRTLKIAVRKIEKPL
jgi:hypothetical protein